MLVSDLFQLSLSYTYLKCVVREDLVTNPFRRVIFYNGKNIDELREGDLLMIRETFWNTYEHDDFIKPQKDIRVAGILLHHRCCSGRFHLQSTVYIKEADLLMRAGNDGEHQTALVETLRALTRTASRGTFDAAGEKKEVSIWK